jgi:hypothetical protein
VTRAISRSAAVTRSVQVMAVSTNRAFGSEAALVVVQALQACWDARTQP